MAEKACVKRLQKEYRALCKEPVSHVVARPSPNDILEWHYVLEGSEGTPFAVHPESWNPMWSVSSILTGLLSFMMDTSPTTGSVTTTVAEKQKLAKASLALNCKNPTFRKLFPEYVQKYEEQQLLVHPVQEEVSSVLAQAENSTPLLDGLNRVERRKDMENQRRKSLPTWLLLLLVSIFGVVMALPLLQL